MLATEETLDESLDELQGGVGHLAPSVVDRERMPARGYGACGAGPAGLEMLSYCDQLGVTSG